VDFDPIDVVDGKGHLRERSSGFGCQSLVEDVLVHPIAYFTSPCAYTSVEPTAPQHLAFLAIEQRIGEVLAQIKGAAILAEAFDLGLEVFGLVLHPEQPRRFCRKFSYIPL
jgi:hypothetical protein